MQSIEKLIEDFPSQEELAKLPKDGGNKWNRLIFEQSPYLLQHAANPVDWYPWGDDAFAKAKLENKPVMLSIGYSTCHWCHVMEHECFEDSEVAELLNQHMICIKVDREERPDIDNLYMTFAQILIKRGGWPLNIFLTPDRKPFFAATYVPKHSKQTQGGVMLGMLDLIPRVANYWGNSQGQVLDSAEKLIDVLNGVNNKNNKEEFLITDDLINEIYEITFQNLSKNYDSKYGGFGSAPKFPSPHIFGFLFSHYRRTKNYRSLDMGETTLLKMRMGGLFDQIGKGFHRYSTDSQWLLPHFEKMLYDQATLLTAYADGFMLTQNPALKNVIYEIFEYLNRDLKSSHGAYYSAEDADSEGEEGKFYIWTIEELSEILSKEELELCIKTFNCKEEGNFHDEATRKLTGANVLLLSDIKDIQNPQLQVIISKLEKAREQRIRPLLDDKILLDWNALLIVGLIRAYKATLDSKFTDAAKDIFNFIHKELYDGKKLHKAYRKERSSAAACINDYAFLLWALVEFHDISQDSKTLQDAINITNTMIEDFWSDSAQAFSFNAIHNQEIPTQNFEFYDGAIPSANSVIFFAMNKLYNLTQNLKYKEITEKLFSSYIPKIEQYPSGYTQFISNLELSFSDYQEQKFCGEGGCGI